MDKLFRKEALDSQSELRIGDVIIYTPIRQYVMVVAVIVPAIVLFLFCFYGSYSRKERVTGTIVPDRGIINVVSDRAGILDKLYVAVSDEISKNEPLLEVKLETVLGDGSILETSILDELTGDLGTLQLELELNEKRYINSRKTLNILEQRLNTDIGNIKNQLDLQEERVGIEAKKNEKFSKLILQEAVSELEVTAQQSLYINEQQNLMRLEFEAAKLKSDLRTIAPQIENAKIQRDTERTSIEKKISEINRQRIRSKSSGRIVLRSTVDGKIASLSVRQGQSITANRSLMTILPEGGQLVAELFVPSRAAGFISTGQNVRLFYDAYPFQKFGASNGIIIEISETILPGNDNGFTNGVQEPYFNVVVELERQTVEFDGQSFQLQSGMQLGADIILEERKVWEWLLQPILKILR